MAEHLKKSQDEINALCTEYWRLRQETGEFLPSARCGDGGFAEWLYRSLHGDSGEQAGYAGHHFLEGSFNLDNWYT